jgi:hypothetical protein
MSQQSAILLAPRLLPPTSLLRPQRTAAGRKNLCPEAGRREGIPGSGCVLSRPSRCPRGTAWRWRPTVVPECPSSTASPLPLVSEAIVQLSFRSVWAWRFVSWPATPHRYSREASLVPQNVNLPQRLSHTPLDKSAVIVEVHGVVACPYLFPPPRPA